MLHCTQPAVNIPSMIPEASAEATLSVSIVLHDSDFSSLGATLDSLICAVLSAQRRGVLGSASLSVLDNQSSQDYRRKLPEFLRSHLEKTNTALPYTLQFAAQNQGFGLGHNEALAPAAAAFFLILNPDVELAETAIYEALAGFRSHPEAVAANPYCERTDGSREYLCKRYPNAFDLFLRGTGSRRLQKIFARRLSRYECQDLGRENAQEVRLLSGACLFCRSGAFRAVGGFSPAFFMYFEDFDLSLRIARQGKLLYLPSVRIIHRGGFAARKGQRHVRWFMRSALVFFSRNGWRFF